MIDKILGNRYEIQQELGKKAGRRTLLARDLVTNELVVIKLLSFTNDFEWDSLKLFEREANTLKSLSHPFIPHYLDYFEVNLPTIKGFALVQTYIPAQTLEQYLQAGRTFTEAELREIASSVLSILIYLHGLNPPVIHRDIKPSNILLGDRSGNSVGQVYLVDFGSVQTAKTAEVGTRTVVGTYGYMPPEQFGGRTVNASDLYGLGTTLIYLVTGTHPADLPQKDLRIQFEQAAHCSSRLTTWLRWMTEPSLEKRLSSADKALEALDEMEVQSSRTLIAKKQTPIKNQLTKIQLDKNEDVLEIIIPPNVSFSAIFKLLWVFPVILFSLARIISASADLTIMVFCFIAFCVLCQAIFDLFGYIRLCIDSQQITLAYNLFGVIFYFCQSSRRGRHSISKLVYIRSHFIETARGQTEESAKLQIWAGEENYQLSIPSDRVTTEAEIEWLVSEVSDWLGVEITNL
ncbi:serine/threonine protein kinase [Cylindrospermum stagnale PCC 7417]|uniref:Serine/threonine protein kinase n=1 Tax=Cylindrospermum stagnale PCC 7417 TaxID=56107 RepID=K9X4Y0_9NOST|nr:serine/threonine-protein kinase [Cylindrospermum stagnale]AFZ27730.1 serine/threonine protein kinase [Cylindrospermum stagnale PCC 7417]